MSMDFSKRMKPVLHHSVFRLTDFVVWCGTMVKDDDGLYYLYFSFWPKNKGHDAWVTHSQIGYATSKEPLGPFEYQGIALSGSGGDGWDRDCVHNPAAIKVDGMYYIYYMGNFGDGSYWSHRNNQRIGVAFSNNPKGPFKRLDKPVIDITPGKHDALMTSNPCVTIGPDKRLYMIYKAVSDKGVLPKGGAVVCAIAIAENPLGPFIKEENPIMTNPTNDWSVEDPCIWYEGGSFYSLVKDFQGYFTNGKKSSVALFESKNGIDWQPSENCFVFNTELLWEDGMVEPLRNMERPQLFFDENAKPIVLLCACCKMESLDKTDTFNVQIGIE